MSISFVAAARRLRMLAAGAACTAGFFLLASGLELSERLSDWLSTHERWQVDELALTLAVSTGALAWYAARRSRAAVHAETRVTALLSHNRELAQRLIQSQEMERRALARELHDEVGQNCSAIRAEASYILRAGAADRATVRDCATRIGTASENLHALVRRMLQRLRPPALDSLGLEAALQELCESWQQQHRIACAFAAAGVPERLDDVTSITIYRLVQEALTNVARHSGARQVSVSLQTQPDDSLALTIEDDGCGMTGPAPARNGFGLSGMRERVSGMAGSIAWRNAPARGLRIDVILPGVAVAP